MRIRATHLFLFNGFASALDLKGVPIGYATSLYDSAQNDLAYFNAFANDLRMRELADPFHVYFFLGLTSMYQSATDFVDAFDNGTCITALVIGCAIK